MNREYRIQNKDSNVWTPDSIFLTQKKLNEHKDIPFRAKAKLVEESKKGHTGDALALRGDEGRDKLR